MGRHQNHQFRVALRNICLNLPRKTSPDLPTLQISYSEEDMTAATEEMPGMFKNSNKEQSFQNPAEIL